MRELIDRIRSSEGGGVAIDTNLLLLMVVGLTDSRLISRFKRTSKYSEKEFKFVNALAFRFAKRWTTPAILAEVSNFCGQVPGEGARRCRAVLASLVTGQVDEHLEPSRVLAENPLFLDLGLTDVGILQWADCNVLLLSNDLSLCFQYERKGGTAVNLNHFRESIWVDA